MLKSTITGLRQLLDGQRVLSLAVLAEGAPYVGLLPFVALPDRSGVLIHASRLARHSRGLDDGASVGVLLHEPDGPHQDALQIRRASFDCRVRPLERHSTAWSEGRTRYVARFPQSDVTFGLGDFTLHRLEFERGVYVEGFARAIAVDADDLLKLRD